MSNEIDYEQINQICEQIDILEYASKTVDFEEKGRDCYSAHCPNHIDKTASLFITPSINKFHCFSCGKGGNVLNWMMTYEGMSFKDSLEKIKKITGKTDLEFKQCSAMKIFKESKKNATLKLNDDTLEDERVIPDSYYDKYSNELPQEWIDEGITKEAMRAFNIKTDTETNRIVYPVYNERFQLIGVKGRTRYKKFKEMAISKYMNYFKIGTTNFFIGMKEQFHSINLSKNLIIFEGIKSVMKAYGWGYRNCVAAETSYLNEEQIKILLKMGIKDITIAFDSDVELSKIMECTKTLRRFSNVYVIMDRKNPKEKLLGEKESPVDKGREVFEKLLAERKRLI